VWRARAARRRRAAQAAADDVELEILDRQELAGAQPRDDKGDLVVDVRLRGGKDTFLVEVQHRVKPHFPRRALLDASAEIVLRHMADVQCTFYPPWRRPCFGSPSIFICPPWPHATAPQPGTRVRLPLARGRDFGRGRVQG